MTPIRRYGLATPDVNAAKPLRADARRNRIRVLEAADEVFASKGTGASTEEVARHAGVGVGTVFRHFPTKEALLEAVLVERFGRLAEEARSLAGAERAGPALFDFLARIVNQSASKNAFTEALTSAGVNVENSIGEVGQELWSALDTLLTQAQRAGAVREDVRTDELIVLIVGASRAAEYASRDADLQARAVAVIFDGLRPAPSA
ncbi:TetR/AcrR family transcriptional regulator [Rugosimonospora africana]|uniref:TetR family transcriptional regulator n=1 Tax=Rugosimonospora africana TaxID=556532 RepID=A0A8J3R0M1_9ACTN|nr:TetR/AcrR family transcriptional regulator [Rugosimonospora africana]GIH19190.1 TetR family transcriptional regulator [Rugosimonospora africana]